MHCVLAGWLVANIQTESWLLKEEYKRANEELLSRCEGSSERYSDVYIDNYRTLWGGEAVRFAAATGRGEHHASPSSTLRASTSERGSDPRILPRCATGVTNPWTSSANAEKRRKGSPKLRDSVVALPQDGEAAAAAASVVVATRGFL